ncbi:MAG: ferredoxin [Chitinivibrionales bacterium]|nr:ferredoxin [Chitinivibrionales bacterium]MBD3395100.1 ferredoxin [Chitinivibrionales bacterium]
MRAHVIPEKCTGCELCVATCPEVFEMTDENIAREKTDEAPDAARGSCREAAEDCPAEAIEIDE